MISQLNFETSELLWLIFDNCWCRGSDVGVERTCSDLSLTYVQILHEVATSPVTVRLATKPAGYAFESVFPEISNIFRQHLLPAPLLTPDSLETSSNPVQVSTIIPRLFRVLLLQRPKGNSIASFKSTAKNFSELSSNAQTNSQ